VQKQWHGSSDGCAQCNSIRGKSETQLQTGAQQVASPAGMQSQWHCGHSCGSVAASLLARRCSGLTIKNNQLW